MVFLGADVQSLGLIQDVLQSFKKLSRLSAKFNGKMRLAAVPLTLKQQILAVFQFKEGKLPVRYLGVRLISKRLPEKETFGG